MGKVIVREPNNNLTRRTFLAGLASAMLFPLAERKSMAAMSIQMNERTKALAATVKQQVRNGRLKEYLATLKPIPDRVKPENEIPEGFVEKAPIFSTLEGRILSPFRDRLTAKEIASDEKELAELKDLMTRLGMAGLPRVSPAATTELLAAFPVKSKLALDGQPITTISPFLGIVSDCMDLTFTGHGKGGYVNAFGPTSYVWFENPKDILYLLQLSSHMARYTFVPSESPDEFGKESIAVGYVIVQDKGRIAARKLAIPRKTNKTYEIDQKGDIAQESDSLKVQLPEFPMAKAFTPMPDTTKGLAVSTNVVKLAGTGIVTMAILNDKYFEIIDMRLDVNDPNGFHTQPTKMPELWSTLGKGLDRKNTSVDRFIVDSDTILHVINGSRGSVMIFSVLDTDGVVKTSDPFW